MSFFNMKNNLIDAVSELENADYSKQPKLGDIYKRLLKGREQFQVVMDRDISAVMQISSLDLILKRQTERLVDITNDISNATQKIHIASQESSLVAEQVNGQHEKKKFRYVCQLANQKMNSLCMCKQKLISICSGKNRRK